jgi:hypothetical protein
MGAAGQRGKWDILAGAILREDGARFTDIYRLLLRAARAEGIDRDRLHDFLDLQDGGEFALLGQDELGTSVFENALRDQIARSAAEGHCGGRFQMGKRSTRSTATSRCGSSKT